MKQKLLYICLVIAAFAWNGKAAGQVHLPINPMTQDIFNACKVDTEGSCDWNGGIHLGGNSEGFNYDDRYCVIKFDGIPAVISFDYEAKGYLLNPTSIEWYVQVGTNGNDFIDAWRVSLGSDRAKKTQSIKLSDKYEYEQIKNIRYVKFCYSGNFQGTFSNIKITELQYLTTDKESLDFGVNPRNSTTTPQEIKISHCNAGLNSGISVTSSDPEHFEVSPINFDENGNPGRDVMGTGTFTIRYLPKDRGTHTGTITISDGVNPDVTVQVQGETTLKQVEPIFEWTMSDVVYTNRTYAGFFSTNNGDCDYIITCTPEDMARIDKLTDEEGRPDYHITFFDKTGEVTFSVTQEGNDDGWLEHSETYQVIVEEAHNHVPFTINSQLNYNIFIVGNDSYNRNSYADDAIRLGGGNNGVDDLQRDGRHVVIEFSGIPDKLSFTTSVGGAVPTKIGFYVQEAEVNGQWGTNIWEINGQDNRNNTVSDLQLKPTTRFLKIGYTGNYWAFIKDLTVTERFDFYTDKSSLSFEEIYDDESTSLPIILSHCNAGNGVKVVSSDSHFTITPEILTSTGGDRMGEETITVTYHNDELLITDNHSVTHTGTITITDDTPLGSNPQPFEPIVIEVTGVSVPSTLYLKPENPSYEERTYKHVALNRKLKTGYNSIALPFDTNVEELAGSDGMAWVAQLQTVTWNNADGYSLYFQEVNGQIKANQPYVLYLSEDVESRKWENINKEITAPEPATIYAKTEHSNNEGWSMASNYEPGFSMAGKYGIVNGQGSQDGKEGQGNEGNEEGQGSEGGLLRGGEGSTLNAFAAYIAPPSGESGNAFRVRAAYIDRNGTATFVEGLPFADGRSDADDMSTSTAGIYSPDGLRRSQLMQGVNIVRYGNGQTRKVYK